MNFIKKKFWSQKPEDKFFTIYNGSVEVVDVGNIHPLFLYGKMKGSKKK